jgi:hypothetical protein
MSVESFLKSVEHKVERSSCTVRADGLLGDGWEIEHRMCG